MPAAAVIPAPIAYIKIVAVKTLVVGYLSGSFRSDLSVDDSELFRTFVVARTMPFIG